MDVAYSVNNVPIRLTYERWYHITENHDDLASYYWEVLETVENPEFVVQGNKRTLKQAKIFQGINGLWSFIKNYQKRTAS